MEPSTIRKDRFWAYVTAFGALWGAFEITLGSFLHTLHLPFAGVLLASTGAGLLTAQRQFLPTRGISLATGAVASLAKSLSPGGVILGPMVGILTEALLVELALLPAPRSRSGAAVAGMLCALWATLQKILSQYLFFGGTILELYVALLRRSTEWLGISESAGWFSVAAFLSLLALMGAAGGVIGSRLGAAAHQHLLEKATA